MKLIDKVQKVRKEVEKLKSQLLRGACSSQIAMETRCKEEAYNEVLSILDTMQEEHCTETEFREIEILRTKLSDIAKAIYYYEGKENPTMERIREIVQDCCFELMDLKKPKQEKPVSEELEQAIDTYLKSYWGGEKEKQDWPFLKKMVIHFANWQKEQFEKNRLKHCNSITNEQAELEQGFIDQHLDKYQRMPTFLDAIEYGMNLQKEQMMANAIDAEVLENYDGKILEYDDSIFDKKLSNCKVFDKVKIVVIKKN